MAFVVGNKVTLIREGNWHTYDLDGSHKPLPSGIVVPSYGEVYTISEILPTRSLGVTLNFREIRNPPVVVADNLRTIGFLAKLFRRVTDISVFKKLLAPSPSLELDQLTMDEKFQAMDD